MPVVAVVSVVTVVAAVAVVTVLTVVTVVTVVAVVAVVAVAHQHTCSRPRAIVVWQFHPLVPLLRRRRHVHLPGDQSGWRNRHQGQSKPLAPALT